MRCACAPDYTCLECSIKERRAQQEDDEAQRLIELLTHPDVRKAIQDLLTPESTDHDRMGDSPSSSTSRD